MPGKIVLAFWGIVVVLTALWLLADAGALGDITVFGLRAGLIQYTGIMGIGMMSVAMILAARPRWLEPPLDGLDKMYRLHKWLGIGGLVLAIAHWLWAVGPRWLAGWGWIASPQGGRPGGARGGAPGSESTLQAFFGQYHRLAETVGEWTFYALVVLTAVALVKLVPYRWFLASHRWMSVIFLLLVFHSVILMKTDYWTQPVGIVTGLLMAAGTVAAVLSLIYLVRDPRDMPGTIAGLRTFPALNVLELTVDVPPDRWRGHQAGQFAFVTASGHEGAHPFTLASAWQGDGRLVFAIKNLGDYTRSLVSRLHSGDPVKVEGPYGHFTFEDQAPSQIWVGGGIGITPFLARMKTLAGTPHQQRIDFFFSTADFDANADAEVRGDAAAAHVNLRVLLTPRDGRLSAERIREEAPDWREASIWFCGPGDFGRALRGDFVAHGFPAARFHQELFEMR